VIAPWRIISLGVALVLLSIGWMTSPAVAGIVDATGREVSLKHEPRKIVTLAPSLTEIVYFLGLGDRVVGVTQFSYFPPEARNKPKVGSYVDLNAEKIISLAPDLVIGTKDGNQPAVVELLEQAGLPVFIVNPKAVRQVVDTVVTIGQLCGVADKASALAHEMSMEIDRIVAKTTALHRPLVFLQVNSKPIISVNQKTFTHDLIRLAGGRNMTETEPVAYPRISLEEVVRRKPDVIIISSMQRGGDFEEAKRQWLKWSVIPAVKHNRVYLVDSDLTDRPSPRIIQGLKILARYIHPEVDWEHD